MNVELRSQQTAAAPEFWRTPMLSIGISRAAFVLLLAIVAIAVLSTNSSAVAQGCVDECKIIRDNCIAGTDPTAKAKAQCASQYRACEKKCNQKKSSIPSQRTQSPIVAGVR